MRIGCPKEIKPQENRAGLTPPAARELVAHGHEVLVQAGAGSGIGCDDAQYVAAGARVVPDAASVFEAADMIVKVKETQPQECRQLHKGQVLFTYLPLAPDPVQTRGLIDSGCTAIAYETITDARGQLPLLAPMSEVARSPPRTRRGSGRSSCGACAASEAPISARACCTPCARACAAPSA